MLREIKHFNNLNRSLIRLYSGEAARKVTNFQEEWNNAKPYDQVPKLTKFALIKGFLPGGLNLFVKLLNFTKITNFQASSARRT